VIVQLTCNKRNITRRGHNKRWRCCRWVGTRHEAAGLPQEYSPSEFEVYFRTRPVQVLGRCLEILLKGGGWILEFNKDAENVERELGLACRLRAVLTSLGPSFVKLGQVLSSRVDLLPATYIQELKSLTDQVAPFPYDVACETLREEWAACQEAQHIEQLSREPIAAASLGQVYRVEMNGQVLAVKVQRPGVREQVCLDLFVLRGLAPWAKRLLQVNTDLVALVDEYGSRFVGELDYTCEAQNAERFQEALVQAGLQTALCTATPVKRLTTQRVLVTEWVEGRRIDSECSPEGARLCGVALTAYLLMLLETGKMHADPHPGNLLATTDGRLCILDWGLVTTVVASQQDAIISYFVHILAEDYAAIPDDLVNLGFIAQGRQSVMQDQVVASAISDVFRGLASGGSARKRISGVIPAVQEIRRRYGNIGQLPAYFTYILRAFSVLEGIGLEQDPDYSIVLDCYPYLVSRLLREDGDRAQQVLQALLYGAAPSAGAVMPPLNASRVVKLINAFNAYAQMEATEQVGSNNVTHTEQGDDGASAASAATSEAAKAREGRHSEVRDSQPQGGDLLRRLAQSSALQEVAVLELARTTDVLSREALEAVVPPAFRNFAPARTSEDEAVLESWQEIREAVMQEDVSQDVQAWLRHQLGIVIKGGRPSASTVTAFQELFGSRSRVAASSLRFAAEIFDRAAARLEQ